MPRRTFAASLRSLPHRPLLLASLALAIASGAACAKSAPNQTARLAAPPPTVSASTTTPTPPVEPIDASKIDGQIRAEWQKAGIAPAPRVDDARFLRRAYIDVVGTLPPPEAVIAFEKDTSQDKRARLVASLIASPQYAEHWASVWDDVLMGTQVREPFVDRAVFHQWLRERFAANTPWNKIAYELVAAEGQNSDGGARRGGYAPVASATPIASAMPSAMPMPSANAATDASARDAEGEGDQGDSSSPVRPAVNWALKFGSSPQDLAGSASRIFLGVQIQCAQCHDHKTEKWKQTDFEKFAASFVRTQLRPIDKTPAMGQVRRVELKDVSRPVPRFAKNPDAKSIAQSKPTALDGTDLSESPKPRAALAAWMTSDKNPWFAQAFVNRMWAHFLGRGFVDPVDDMRPSNAATMPTLLQEIADDFVAHGYDVKRLVATLAKTEAYQLAASPAATSKAGEGDAPSKLWARFRLAPMGPEELLNALMQATSLEAALKKNGRVNLEQVRVQLGQKFAFLFDVDEEIDHEAFEGTIAQALAMLNGSLVGSGASALPGGAVADVMAMTGGDAEKVDRLYVRTLARHPSAEETAYWVKVVSDAQGADANAGAGAGADASASAGASASADAGARATPKRKPPPGANDPLRRLEAKDASTTHDARTRAYEDLLWALLNSSEFLFNH